MAQEEQEEELSFTATAAIDFGTARTGYAFAYKAKPDEIQSATGLAGAPPVHLKTLTNILLDEEHKYVAFGYEARDEYFAECAEGEEGNLFFERFKMSLYEEGKDEHDGQVLAENGKSAPSHNVLREALRFMQESVLSDLNAQSLDGGVRAEDVMWVLTVPGMWSDRSKQAMHLAAEAAGMGTKNNLMLALEPEAASLWMRAEYEQLPTGSKYVVVDCGGGTVDFACHEVLDNNTVRETHPALGGPWGSTYVDKEYVKLLEELVGSEQVEKFRRANPASWLKVMDNWESAKITMKNYRQKKGVELPASFVSEIGPSAIATACRAYADGDIKYVEGTLRMNGDVIKKLFNPMVESIRNQIKSLLEVENVKDSRWLFVVGGFAESKILQDELKTRFPDIKVVIPKKPGLAIIFGAVKYGFTPSLISTRRSRLTYGIAVQVPFIEGVHPESKMTITDDKIRCTDVFNVFVKRGQELAFDEVVSREYNPSGGSDTTMTIQMFASNDENPQFTTDEGVKKVATIEVDLSDLTGGDTRKVRCEMKFGGTEIGLTAINHAEQIEKAAVDFMRY